MMSKILLAAGTSDQGLGCGGGLGPIAEALCNLQNSTAGKEEVGNRLNSLVSGILGFLTVIASLWFFFQIVIGGYLWISAGGDKNNITMAKDRIVHALIGFVIVTSAWVIIGVIGKIIGLDILNPGAILQTLGI